MDCGEWEGKRFVVNCGKGEGKSEGVDSNERGYEHRKRDANLERGKKDEGKLTEGGEWKDEKTEKRKNIKDDLKEPMQGVTE